MMRDKFERNWEETQRIFAIDEDFRSSRRNELKRKKPEKSCVQFVFKIGGERCR